MRIDSETKRKQAERIRRIVTKSLLEGGFKRHRTTWWVREKEHILQLIHFHLFTFNTSFRVHLSIHVRDFDGEDSVLNGLSSHDGWFEHKTSWLRKPKKYVFRFNRLPESVDKCAAELVAYCMDVAEPWFRDHESLEKLLNDKDSPLSEVAKEALRNRLNDSDANL